MKPFHEPGGAFSDVAAGLLFRFVGGAYRGGSVVPGSRSTLDDYVQRCSEALADIITDLNYTNIQFSIGRIPSGGILHHLEISIDVAGVAHNFATHSSPAVLEPLLGPFGHEIKDGPITRYDPSPTKPKDKT